MQTEAADQPVYVVAGPRYSGGGTKTYGIWNQKRLYWHNTDDGVSTYADKAEAQALADQLNDTSKPGRHEAETAGYEAGKTTGHAGYRTDQYVPNVPGRYQDRRLDYLRGYRKGYPVGQADAGRGRA